MDQFILWLNMIAFALMVTSAGLVHLVYLRSRHRWLRSFIVYTGAYAFWLLFGTYVFFQATFMTTPIQILTVIFSYVRVMVSFVILISGSLFYLSLGSGSLGNKEKSAITVTTAIIGILVVFFLGYNMTWAATLATLIFNGYFSVLSLYALFMVLKSNGAQRRMFIFLSYSTIAYLLLVTLTVILIFIPPAFHRGIPVNVLASGIFAGVWGLLMILVAARWVTHGIWSSNKELPLLFVEDHSISRREAEIVNALRQGLTSKEIGGRLFISERTVEAHIYNIYRKCGVSNRVELINLISRYI